MAYKHFEAIEKNAGLLGVLIAIMVSLGGLAEIVPLFVRGAYGQGAAGRQALRPAAAGRQGHLCARGLLPLPLADDPRAARRDRSATATISMAGESVYDRPFQWGSKRTGPDLARVGGKYSDEWQRAAPEEPARGRAGIEHAGLSVAGASNKIDAEDIAGAHARAAPPRRSVHRRRHRRRRRRRRRQDRDGRADRLPAGPRHPQRTGAERAGTGRSWRHATDESGLGATSPA